MLLYFVPREAAVKQQDHPTEQCVPGAGYQDSLSRTRTAWEKVPEVMGWVFWRPYAREDTCCSLSAFGRKGRAQGHTPQYVLPGCQ